MHPKLSAPCLRLLKRSELQNWPLAISRQPPAAVGVTDKPGGPLADQNRTPPSVTLERGPAETHAGVGAWRSWTNGRPNCAANPYRTEEPAPLTTPPGSSPRRRRPAAAPAGRTAASGTPP